MSGGSGPRVLVHPQYGVLLRDDVLGRGAGVQEVHVAQRAVKDASLPPDAALAEHSGFQLVHRVHPARMGTPRDDGLL
jgi:hypothetical protein